jgi:hypothetical protein
MFRRVLIGWSAQLMKEGSETNRRHEQSEKSRTRAATDPAAPRRAQVPSGRLTRSIPTYRSCALPPNRSLGRTLSVKRIAHGKAHPARTLGGRKPFTSMGSPMDEAATLRFLGWTVGGVIGVVFLLNALALSLI